MSHTDFPWSTAHAVMRDNNLAILDADDCIVALVLPTFVHGVNHQTGNAEFIVRAVNQRNELIEMLREFVLFAKQGGAIGDTVEAAERILASDKATEDAQDSESLRCPVCKSDKEFSVTAEVSVTVRGSDYLEIIDEQGDREYGAKSTCVCKHCGHRNQMSAFYFNE